MNFSWSRIGRLTRKELRETLRDRRTILTLVLMPLLVYPLLSMALNRFLLSSGGPAADGFVVGVTSEAEQILLQSILEDPRSQPPQAILDSSDGVLANFRVVSTAPESAIDLLIQNKLDIAAEIRKSSDGLGQVIVTAFAGDAASLSARRVLVERLQWLKLAEATQMIEKYEPEFPQFAVDAAVIGNAESGSMLGTVIPLVLVLMTITGAVYPAIDLTAGERERGTMEALMASPVPRAWVLFAKYIAVVMVALLTAVMNLVAMFVTLSVTGLLELLGGDGNTLSWIAITQVFGLLVLFSAFFSAVLLSLTSFAKSFKEAQAYLIPVMLLSLAPAMLSLMPGIPLAGPLAVAPLINIVLLARDVLSNSVEPLGATLAIVSTIAYAGAALGLASKLFGSDAVTRTSEQSIGSLLRRPRVGTPRPTVAEAAMVVAILLPTSFVVSNALTQWVRSQSETPDIAINLIFNAIGLFLAFGLVPAIAIWLGRHKPVDSYRLHRAPWGTFVGAMVLSLGAWAFAHELIVLANEFGIALLRDDQIESARELLEKWKTVSPVLLLATLALAPAVIEELCFRGYLFSAFSTKLSPVQTIVTTAILFGLFHVFVGSTLLVERFLPTAMLGLLLGWLAYRSGSVLPGILLHFLHNGLLELVAKYHEQLGFLGEDYESSSHLPATWLAAAGTCVLVGIAIVALSGRRTRVSS